MDKGIGVKDRFQFGAEAGGGDGIKATGKPFAGNHDVRLYAIMLYSPEFAGAPQSRLHLISDEKRPMPVTQFLRTW